MGRLPERLLSRSHGRGYLVPGTCSIRVTNAGPTHPRTNPLNTATHGLPYHWLHEDIRVFTHLCGDPLTKS